MRMSVCVAALAIAVGVSVAATADPAAQIWDGQLVFADQTAQCSPAFELKNGTTEALYRPSLLVTDPKAALIIYGTGQVGQFQAHGSTASMNGSGSYDGTYYSAALGTTQAWTGTYTLAVTPSNVKANTRYVYVTGTIDNFANIAGCSLTINSAFLLRLP